jgi:hypothetical protein
VRWVKVLRALGVFGELAVCPSDLHPRGTVDLSRFQFRFGEHFARNLCIVENSDGDPRRQCALRVGPGVA